LSVKAFGVIIKGLYYTIRYRLRLMKTRSIQRIEERMEGVSESTLRHKVLEDAKSFKTSWIRLGQSLYTVWRDRLYRDWGYSNFDVYAAKEIGIRKQTASKLLKSYYFLERKEPGYLKEEFNKNLTTASVPTYETVNALRLASKKKEIGEEDYAAIKRDVFQGGKSAHDIRKNVATLIRERRELEPEEARKSRKHALLRRLIGTLRSIRTEVKVSKMLPAKLINDTETLISKIEQEL